MFKTTEVVGLGFAMPITAGSEMRGILIFILGLSAGVFLNKKARDFLERPVIVQNANSMLFKSDQCDLLEMNSLLKSSRYSIGAEKLRLFYVNKFLSKPLVSVKIPKSLLHYKMIRKTAGVEVEESTTPCGMSPALAKFIHTPGPDTEESVYLNFISPEDNNRPVELDGLSGESIEVLFYPAFT